MKNLEVLLAISVVSVLLPLGVEAAPATEKLPSDSFYQVKGEFQDQSGATTSLSKSAGSTTLLAMFYATCPMACPMLIADIKRVLDGLSPEEKKQVTVVLVSLDPKRDTVERLAKVITERALDPARWKLLRTDPSTTRTLAAALGVRFRANDDGSIDHTSKIVLLDQAGRQRAQRDAIGSEPEAFVSAIRAELGR